MSKINEKIIGINFLKFFRLFLPLAIIVVLLGGIVTCIIMKAQISEAVNYVHGEKYISEGICDYGELSFITEPSAPVKIYVGTFGLICLILFGVYWITMALWLYKKAVLSKMHGALWLILSLCSNIFAVLVFFVVRGFVRCKCSECGNWQNLNTQYCVKCGKKFHRICTECGQQCGKDDKYCMRCGSNLSANKIKKE